MPWQQGVNQNPKPQKSLRSPWTTVGTKEAALNDEWIALKSTKRLQIQKKGDGLMTQVYHIQLGQKSKNAKLKLILVIITWM